MRNRCFAVAAGTAFAVAAAGLAGVAEAAPTGGGNAADTVKDLRADGYSVQINGSRPVPLSDCVTTGVHRVPTGPVPLASVYVNVSCPDPG
jgi:hypothetical protein